MFVLYEWIILWILYYWCVMCCSFLLVNQEDFLLACSSRLEVHLTALSHYTHVLHFFNANLWITVDDCFLFSRHALYVNKNAFGAVWGVKWLHMTNVQLGQIKWFILGSNQDGLFAGGIQLIGGMRSITSFLH